MLIGGELISAAAGFSECFCNNSDRVAQKLNSPSQLTKIIFKTLLVSQRFPLHKLHSIAFFFMMNLEIRGV
jgi:hypothetical protein